MFKNRNLSLIAFLTLLALQSSRTALAQTTSGYESSEFWNHWGDGKAEIAAYDLEHPRYGEQRSGLAVSIFVTENFSISKGVKTDKPHQGNTDVVPVLKLNLVEDFPTGVYDYNLMTSVFTSSEARFERPRGVPLKVSFSSQEWCGHVYHQLRFDSASITSTSHSYFEGEQDQESSLPYPKTGVSEDALFHWARGFSAPYLSPGESQTLPLLPSLKTIRLKHITPDWADAVFARSKQPSLLKTEEGEFEVETFSVQKPDGSKFEIFVEKAYPNRIIKWSSFEGATAELIASERLEYWSLKDKGSVELLKEIGVSPRPARTS